jgi:16S rRNA processing protein RimM
MLENDEYKVDDIIGMRVILKDGTYIGIVTDVMYTGANDVYTVDTGKGEVLIPAIKDVIKSISVEKKEMIIEPLEGLF